MECLKQVFQEFNEKNICFYMTLRETSISRFRCRTYNEADARWRFRALVPCREAWIHVSSADIAPSRATRLSTSRHVKRSNKKREAIPAIDRKPDCGTL